MLTVRTETDGFDTISQQESLRSKLHRHCNCRLQSTGESSGKLEPNSLEKKKKGGSVQIYCCDHCFKLRDRLELENDKIFFKEDQGCQT